MSCASPVRDQSSVGNVGGAGSRVPGAPSGAGRGVSPRVPRIGAELGAWSRLRPADGVRGRGGRGDMFGRGSSVVFDGAKIRKILQNSVWF